MFLANCSTSTQDRIGTNRITNRKTRRANWIAPRRLNDSIHLRVVDDVPKASRPIYNILCRGLPKPE